MKSKKSDRIRPWLKNLYLKDPGVNLAHDNTNYLLKPMNYDPRIQKDGFFRMEPSVHNLPASYDFFLKAELISFEATNTQCYVS